MKIKSLHDLLVEELKDLYDAEHRIIEALPLMEKAASHSDLKKAFKNHLEETKHHVSRLEDAFTALEVKPARKACEAIKGIIEEGEETLDEDMPDDVKDAAIIGAAQRVEHYEMAVYGTARSWAELLGYEEVAALLQETLDEEGEADQTLSELALSAINPDAKDEGDVIEEDEEEKETKDDEDDE